MLNFGPREPVTSLLRKERNSRVLLFLSILWVCFVLPSAGQASDLHLDFEFGTDMPISVGTTVSLELPYDLRFSSSLGYLPDGYVKLINSVVESFPDTYDEATGDLIEETLQDALIWRTHVGWYIASGWYIDAGYGLATLGGGTSTEALISALIPDASTSGNGTTIFDVGSTLHMFDAELGWKHVFQKRFTFRAALGLAATVAASATVSAQSSPEGARRQRWLEQFESRTEQYLVDTYTNYVITPVFTLSVGYRLF